MRSILDGRRATAIAIAAIVIASVIAVVHLRRSERGDVHGDRPTVVYASVTEAEPNDAPRNAQLLATLPAEVHGQLADGDRDVYRLIDDESGAHVLDAWVEDLDGAHLEALDAAGHVGEAVVAPGRIGALGLTRGPIFLVVSGPSGRYRLRVARSAWTAGLEREPNDDPAHAQLLAIEPHGPRELARLAGSATWSRPGDVDCFAVPLAVPPAGAALRVVLHPPAEVQAMVRVLDGGGGDASSAPGVLAELSGTGPGRDVVLPAIGARSWERVYFICTSAVAGAAYGESYRLEVVSFTPDGPFEFEPNDSAETASALPRDLDVSGFLIAGDSDWYRVSSGPPQSLTAELRLPAGVTATLALLDEQHRELAAARGEGRVRAAATAPAFVRVTTLSGGNPPEPYRLSIRAAR